MHYLKPELAYRCPKDGKLKSDRECKKCEYFVESRWHEGQWTVICKYGDVQA